jgi:NAD(P)-dependent dehydrogenase (short-subunit alcohol dehydrogenase family)
MTTVVIIGAGKGLGLATARRFGREGHAVALLARNRAHVDDLAVTLHQEGIAAHGYTADVRDPDSLRSALDEAAQELGPIEILQYSPVPAREFMQPVLDTSADDLVGPIEFSVYGSATAAQSVIPGMRALGRGTLLFVNGASAVRPRPGVSGTSVAFAAQSAYAQLLHDTLAGEGIHVGQLIIPRGIGGGEPSHEPDALAERLWQIHTERSQFRTYAAPLD